VKGSAKAYIEKIAKKGGDITRAKKIIAKSPDVPVNIKVIVEKLPGEIQAKPIIPPEPIKPSAEPMKSLERLQKESWFDLLSEKELEQEIAYWRSPSQMKVDPLAELKAKSIEEVLARKKGPTKPTSETISELSGRGTGIAKEPSAFQPPESIEGRLATEKAIPLTREEIARAKLPPDIAARIRKAEREAEAGTMPLKKRGKISKEPLPELETKASGFNVLEELKRSLEYLKTGEAKIPEAIKKPPVEQPPITKPTTRPLFETIGDKPILTDEGVANVTDLIKSLKPLGREQKKMYGEEFGQRIHVAEQAAQEIGGMAGFRAKLGKMKGEYEKVNPDFEALGKILSEDKIDAAMNKIQFSQLLPGEKLHAGTGFGKLLDGKLPQPRQLELLQEVFGGEFVASIMKQRPLLKRMATLSLEIANIPRSLMAGFMDLSFSGRQGIFAAFRNYKEFAHSWVRQFKEFGSEKAYQAAMDTIKSDPYYNLAREARVSFTELGKLMPKREERYMSPLAEKIPLGIGKLIKMTGRAYTGFANKYRMDISKRMMKDAEALGYKLEGNTEILRPIGDFVNVISGRGKLGKLEPAASTLNAVFFSPRLWSSRMGITLGKYNPLNPLHYMMLPKQVRIEALKTWLAFGGAALTILGAAKMAGQLFDEDIDVETSPLSADFGKIKVGNTRIDISGGLQPIVRTTAQFIAGKTKSSTTGKIREVGEGYPPLTRGEIVGRYIEYKEAPVMSFVTNWLKNQSGMGEKFSLTTELKEKLIPIVVQDMYDIYKDDPGLLPAGLFSALAVFGLGVQTYESKPPAGKRYYK
jgi:hypothetical protein